MSKKYEFVEGDTLTLAGGAVLHRIRAVRDIPAHDVKAGDLGGCIEIEENLPHDDSSWVSKDSRVFGKESEVWDSVIENSNVGCSVIDDSEVRRSEVLHSGVRDGAVRGSTIEDSMILGGEIADGEVLCAGTHTLSIERASTWKKEGV